MRALALTAQQTWLGQRTFWRNAEYAFFTFSLPLAILAAIGLTKTWQLIPGTHVSSVALFVAGILAFGVVVAAYGNLAGRIAILRGEGVLKRILATPLPPAVYLAGELVSTLVTTLLVAVATVFLGWLMFGVTPARHAGLLVIGLFVGITCFAALGLALSTVIRSPDSAGPISNATYLPIAIISGLFDPALKLPGWLSDIVGYFPVKPLANALQDVYNPLAHGFPVRDIVIMAAWAVAGVLIAIRNFRWQP